MRVTPLLIVGLGNHAPTYAGTRHNIGFEVADELLSSAERGDTRWSLHKKTGADVADAVIAGERVILAKPRCFMNVSGTPVLALSRFFHIEPQRILVIHDDMERDFGRVTFRVGGGDHGHNGLRSVSRALRTRDYARLGVGIGRPPGRMDPGRFVLAPFRSSERDSLPVVCADAADAIEHAIRDRWGK